VVQGKVLYIVGEGGRGIQKRIRAWMQEKGITSLPNLRIMLGSIQIHQPAHVEQLKAALNVIGFGTAVRVPRKALLDWIDKFTQRAA
jgi:hypothetical protein